MSYNELVWQNALLQKTDAQPILERSGTMRIAALGAAHCEVLLFPGRARVIKCTSVPAPAPQAEFIPVSYSPSERARMDEDQRLFREEIGGRPDSQTVNGFDMAQKRWNGKGYGDPDAVYHWELLDSCSR